MKTTVIIVGAPSEATNRLVTASGRRRTSIPGRSKLHIPRYWRRRLEVASDGATSEDRRRDQLPR